MMTPKHLLAQLTAFICIMVCTPDAVAQQISIQKDSLQKTVTLSNANMRLVLDYNRKASLSLLTVNGQQVIGAGDGIYPAIKTKDALYTTLQLATNPLVQAGNNKLTVTGIVYGDKTVTIRETWRFSITAASIQFDIDRTLSKPVLAEQASLPVFNFADTATWEGAYQDYGGLAWFYLFNKPLDTYGVYSNSSTFWNSKTGNGLQVSVSAPGNTIAMDYSRTKENKLAFTVAVSPTAITPRYDSGTNRRLFIRDGNNVWAPFTMKAGKTTQRITLAYFDAKKKYDRGTFTGINGQQVSAVLNTIARIGVIGKQHFGGNSWHTPYGPICLHEQYIAQMGLAINDSNYLKGYSQCLDFYRDNAIKPDGRVWARWAYSNEDMMPGEVTPKGFYEAQWGYLLDANPDYVTNVAELYDQVGDIRWVKKHQSSCESALDWILKRDSNNNGLVEMMTDSHKQKKGSDWLDIIWASYENAFVNAKLYRALVLWSNIEKQLGNTGRSDYYSAFAAKMKSSFNKPTTEGGFWDNEQQCYIHWRDKDNSIHGNNMVTPVNFMAIAYGICDDETRKKTILDSIEVQMEKEQLFFWPVCMRSYNAGEGNDWQFPFPAYENGDIFLSWGSVAVNAYAGYKPELAVKYVKRVLAQYAKDGLAFQRYGRAKQDGLGDDILSGNSLSVVGLYQSIYGINPLYNRFYLNPHITPELAGTQIKYQYRGQPLVIDLNTDKYTVSNDQFTISSSKDFGFYSSRQQLLYFNGNATNASLTITNTSASKLELQIKRWHPNQIAFTQSARTTGPTLLHYSIANLEPNNTYTVSISGKAARQLNTNASGLLEFNYTVSKGWNDVLIVRQ